MSLFKKNELKLLFPFYLFYFIISLSGMILPFFMIYFRQLNFSFFQISALFAAYSISMFIFEIPTGAFADGFSRKYSVIMGLFISGIAIILMSLFYSFSISLFLFIIIGFGMTFISGAEEAWAIDNLNYHKRKDLHKEFFIKSQGIIHFARIFSPLLGALIVKFFSILPLWWIWGTGYLIGSFSLFVFGKEKYVPKQIKFSRLFNKTIKNIKKGVKYSYHHKTIFYLVLASIFFAMMIVDGDFWQLFLNELNMPVYMLGIIFSISSIFSIFIIFSARFLEKYKVKNVFIFLISIRILLLLSVLLLYPGLFILGTMIFILSEGLISLRHPILGPYFQKELPKKIRATVTSVKSMGTQSGFAMATLLFGFLADKLSIQNTIPLTGIFGLMTIYCFSKIKD